MRVAVVPAGLRGLVGVAATAAVERVLELLPEADRFLEFPEFLERDLELAIADDLSTALIGPGAADRDYLASVPSSFWMVDVHAVAGWLLVSSQMAAVS